MGHSNRLRLELDWFGQMKDLAEKQRDALMAGRLDAFMLHASLRASIQKAISANRKGNRATGMSASRKVPALPDEITQAIQIIEAIQETDKEIERLISLKREAIMNQMKEIRHGRKALRGYGKPNQKPGGRFFETQG